MRYKVYSYYEGVGAVSLYTYVFYLEGNQFKATYGNDSYIVLEKSKLEQGVYNITANRGDYMVPETFPMFNTDIIINGNYTPTPGHRRKLQEILGAQLKALNRVV